jgi:putative membrane protein
MKKPDIRKFLTLNVMFLAMLGFTFTSCDNSAKKEDTEEVAEEQNEAKFDDNKAEKNADFYVDVAEMSLMEIQLGQLAAGKAVTDEVKELGKRMEAEHTKTLNELKALAEKKQVTIPASLTEDGQDVYNKMNDKTGTDFDKDFCDRMVKDHKDAIDKFEKIVNKSTDADLQQWATSTLPALRSHLDHAMTCQEKLK